jgi:alpha-amylase/alpha-mannosidase (GH57 family)
MRIATEELEARQAVFSEDEMRDLQVWFNLSWFGYTSREKDPELRTFLEKRRDFSETDKNLVLDKQTEIIRSILPRYRTAQEQGRIEVSISPFYHPILPLLCDQAAAREAMPDLRLPREGFRHPEDARWHVARAVETYERVFGRRPRGMWPPEGSVSPEAAAIMAQAGIEWIATDEDILLNTLRRPRSAEIIYAPYRLQLEGSSLNVAFRDRPLSDLIGFTYAKNPPEQAARDLAGHLQNIHSYLKPSSGEHLVSIILDGENPWEYYPDGGKIFLRTLYSLLSQSGLIETTAIGPYLERFPPRMTLGRIFSGSWIGHNFNVWIGRREDNLAWDLLARTRAHLEREQARRRYLAPDVLKPAWNHVYAAEGSDWFWWYGDDYNSTYDSEFDRLFRSHLMQVYRFLGEQPPEVLDEPIVNVGAARPTEHPGGLLNPIIDGLVTHFYEWVAAGSFDVTKSGGAMNVSETMVSRIFWGFNLEKMFFRFDTTVPPLGDEMREAVISLHLEAGRRLRVDLHFPRAAGEACRVETWMTDDGDSWRQTDTAVGYGVKKIVELALDFAPLGLMQGNVVRFHVSVRKGTLELERWPRSGYLELTVPGSDYEATMWMA